MTGCSPYFSAFLMPSNLNLENFAYAFIAFLSKRGPTHMVTEKVLNL